MNVGDLLAGKRAIVPDQQARLGFQAEGLNVGSGWKRLDPGHREVAIEWFVSAVAAQTKFDPVVHLLCPIPDSQSIPSSRQPPRTLLLAEALSKWFPSLKVWDHLRFQKPMPRRVRNEELLFQNLVFTAPVPAEYIILIDDVCTTGSHARAAQRRLRGKTAKDICAISVARTMIDPNEQVFGYRSDSL
jgi:predicted amidophosphoribosyltransferase